MSMNWCSALCNDEGDSLKCLLLWIDFHGPYFAPHLETPNPTHLCLSVSIRGSLLLRHSCPSVCLIHSQDPYSFSGCWGENPKGLLPCLLACRKLPQRACIQICPLVHPTLSADQSRYNSFLFRAFPVYKGFRQLRNDSTGYFGCFLRGCNVF